MNRYNPNIHHRRSIRLRDYDYAQAGLYFITICVQDRACLLGRIDKGISRGDRSRLILNDAGHMVATQWANLITRFSDIELHEYVVMPNHFHAILEIVGATLVVAPDTDLAVAPDTDLAVAPDTDLAVAPDTDLAVAPDTDLVVAPDTDLAVAPDTDLAVAPDTDLAIAPDEGQPQGLPRRLPQPSGQRKTIGDMLGAFKSISTVEYIRGVKKLGWPSLSGRLWQRNYYEHIIRDQKSHETIARYITTNPDRWQDDRFNAQ